jgi:hypothetical protein
VVYIDCGSLLLTGALKVDLGGCDGGEDVAKPKFACAISGIIEAGTVYDECVECVEGGVCGGG